MPFIKTTPVGQASGATAEMYESERARMGYVPNYAKLFSLRPNVYEAWRQLNGAIKNSMDLRRYELVTVATARKLRSSYCTLAHGKVLAEQFLQSETVRAIVADHGSSGLGPVDIAIMDLATKIAEDATSVTAADINSLRKLGMSDANILDVTLAAAARCFFSKVLDALGAQADIAYTKLAPELREVLTVGRPIADD